MGEGESYPRAPQPIPTASRHRSADKSQAPLSLSLGTRMFPRVRREGQMKAFLIAVVGLVVIAIGASYVLGAMREPSSARYATSDVRLDAEMRSDQRFPD